MPIPSVSIAPFYATHAGRVAAPVSANGNTFSAVAGKPGVVAQEFEAFILQGFIEAILPENAEAVFGAGTAGTFWKSMLAEQVARELARCGGVGIARMVEQSIAERLGDGG